MARKPLISPGSILPPQEPAPGDLLSRIVAKDRARRTGEEVPPVGDPGIQEPVNTVTQHTGEPAIQETGKADTRKTALTGTQKTGYPGGQEDGAAGGGTGRARNTGTRVSRSTGTRARGGGDGPAGADGAAEPTDKATFDLPRSLHQRLKVQAAMERRPARAILIELLTQYLDEHPVF